MNDNTYSEVIITPDGFAIDRMIDRYRAYTIKETADIMCISVSKVRNLIRNNLLLAEKERNKIGITGENISTYLDTIYPRGQQIAVMS